MSNRTPPSDPVQEAASLLSLAQRYRSWTTITEDPEKKAIRKAVADRLEMVARQLQKSQPLSKAH